MVAAGVARLKISTYASPLRYGSYVFSVGGARIAGILISSITFPYLVRRLGIETYGIWSYIVALCGFLNFIADPGISNYTTQQVATHKKAAFDLIPDAIVLRLLGSSIATIGVLGIACFEVRSDIRNLLKLYGIGILAVNLVSTDHLLAALEMFHARALLTVSQQATYALAIFTFVRSSADIRWVPISILLSSALASIVGWLLLWRRGLIFVGKVKPSRWGEILVPSFHYAASSLMSNIYHRTGHLVVRWWLGDFALGLYAAAVRLVDILRGFVIIVSQVLMPRIAAAESLAQLRRLARIATSLIAMLSVPLAAGLIGTAHLLIPWVLGAKYVADVPVLQWMAPYLITASAASLFAGTILFALGRHRAYLASTAAGAVIGSILYFTLVPSLGLTGAALAFVLAELVVAAMAWVKIPELHGTWQNPMLSVSFGSAALMFLAIKLANTYTSQIIVLVSVGACVYIMSCGWYVRRLLTNPLA